MKAQRGSLTSAPKALHTTDRAERNALRIGGTSPAMSSTIRPPATWEATAWRSQNVWRVCFFLISRPAPGQRYRPRRQKQANQRRPMEPRGALDEKRQPTPDWRSEGGRLNATPRSTHRAPCSSVGRDVQRLEAHGGGLALDEAVEVGDRNLARRPLTPASRGRYFVSRTFLTRAGNIAKYRWPTGAFFATHSVFWRATGDTSRRSGGPSDRAPVRFRISTG